MGKNITISDCGTSCEGVLRQLYDNMVKSKKDAGVSLDQKALDEIDMQVAKAYQEVLAILQDKAQITEVLNLLVRRSDRNEIDSSNIVALAKDTAKNVVNTHEIRNEGKGTISNNGRGPMMPAFTRDVAPQAMTFVNVGNMLCTASMEKNFAGTMQMARQGDVVSVIAADLIDRATNFMLNNVETGGNRNSQRTIGALIHIYKLVSTGNSAAIECANKMADVFELQDLDIYDIDSKNDRIINVEKLRNEEDRIRRQNGQSLIDHKLIDRTISKESDVSKRTIRIAQKSDSFEENFQRSQREVEKKFYKRKINMAYKDEDLDMLKMMAQQHPDVMRDIIEKILAKYNQAEGSQAQSWHLKKAIMLGQILGEVNKDRQDVFLNPEQAIQGTIEAIGVDSKMLTQSPRNNIDTDYTR